jgi:integrase
MSLTETALKALKPKAKPYIVSDERGLYVEVLPTGGVIWRFRYRLNGRQEKVTLGKYPAIGLKTARQKRDALATKAALGESPAKQKQLAKQALAENTTVRQFGEKYFTDIVTRDRKNPSGIRRYLDNEIYPAIGNKPMCDVTTADVQAIIDRKKHHGREAAAVEIRNLFKRLFDYAIVRGVAEINPARAIPVRFITRQRSRERALSAHEIRIYLQTVHQSNIRRQFKLALHIILLTMVRKAELLLAKWEHVDFDQGEWHIPAEHSKTGKPHVVYLSDKALELFRELKVLAGESPLVLPGRNRGKPFAANALNKALDGLRIPIPPFTIHDMRRTASTHLHEAGFVSDVIEKALNHTIGGVRGVYNRAEYADQRREMLQFWASYVDDLMHERKVVLGRFKAA